MEQDETDRRLRAELEASCTRGAADEALVAALVADAAAVVKLVQLAQHRLASSLSPDLLADARRATTVLQALRSAVDIGNALGRRIELGLQAGAALKAAKAGSRR